MVYKQTSFPLSHDQLKESYNLRRKLRRLNWVNWKTEEVGMSIRMAAKKWVATEILCFTITLGSSRTLRIDILRLNRRDWPKWNVLSIKIPNDYWSLLWRQQNFTQTSGSLRTKLWSLFFPLKFQETFFSIPMLRTTIVLPTTVLMN